MKRLLIFGGSGFVGSNIARLALGRGWNVLIAGDTQRPGLAGIGWIQADIIDEKSVKSAVAKANPSAIVNAAAVADIDKAERDKDHAWKVNVAGAEHVAKACADQKIRHVFISSDAVYSGRELRNTEADAVGPVNFYGRTKAAAENAVLIAHPDTAIIRISLVIGFPLTSGNSFFASLRSRLEKGENVPYPASEIRTPIDVITLSECILELAGNSFSGIMNLGGTEQIDRYTLARKAAIALGFDPSHVTVQDESSVPKNRAPRHKNGVLDISRAQKHLKTALLGIDEGMEKIFKNER